jgi:hypothetical protein
MRRTVFLVALIGCLPVENALSELLAALGTVAPQGISTTAANET